jgi:ascorbate PTS system EIIB component
MRGKKKMIRILVACANGAGTSLMMKMTAEKVLQDLKITEVKIHHCSLSEGVSSAAKYDVVFVPLNFYHMYDTAISKGVSVIGLKNVLSKEEMKTKLTSSGILEKQGV